MNAFTPKVPAQFTGLARQFLREAGAEGATALGHRNRLLNPAFERLARHPLRHMRDGQFAALARAWEALPAPFRVSFQSEIDRRGRKGWITEMTLSPGKLKALAWDGESEHALCVLAFMFEVPATKWFARDGERMSHAMWTASTVGMHALARRFQRGADNSRHAILADLHALVVADINDRAQFPIGKEFRIPAANGTWLGITQGVWLTDHEEHSTVQLVVRTFMDRDGIIPERNRT